MSELAMEKAGVEVDAVEEKPITEELTASGEISYNQTLMAHLSSRLPGTVWRVSKEVGNPVKKGEILALIDAADLGKAKANLLQAIVQFNLRKANYERLHGLEDSVAGRVILEAKSALSTAQVEMLGAQQALANLGISVDLDPLSTLSERDITQRLQFAGLPRSLVETLDQGTATTNLLPIAAPFDGVILERDVVSGEVVDLQKTLFAIADPRIMWLNLRVPQEDAQYLRMGQPVRFQADGVKTETTGKIAWISTSIDEKTRTIEVRAVLDNEAGLLRAHAFGKGRIVLREEPKAVVIPNEAIHSDGLSNLVFVRDKNFFTEGSPKFFHIREVRPGATFGEATEIIAGLLPGEVIATKGSGALLAQLQKSSLGAGCCGND
ncbi:MAG: efflux RND transporter periplasmic adaptor subunit [Planctomycetes bacterium]|nr:efflux RND transporter periplasmic adaptor subunit [Planctomycetota bacterium]